MKLWTLIGEQDVERLRINVYWPDRIQKFEHADGGLKPLPGEEWTDKLGEPLGLPVVHFRNRGKPYGRSEIRDAVPLQDAVNRNLVSMIMAAELTAFQVTYSIGAELPAEITPGMVISINKEAPLTKDEVVQIGTLKQGELVPYIDLARFLKGEIGEITSTPSPIFSDDLRRVSGEAMKQNDAPLVGKVRRMQVGFGEKTGARAGAMPSSARIRWSCSRRWTCNRWSATSGR
jgi:hypothetical protein